MVAYWVYLLSDPETLEPKYVGLTQNPASRAMWHKTRPRKAANHALARWFQDLHTKGLRPRFQELGCISGEDTEMVRQTAHSAERSWIRSLSHSTRGRLLNIDWNEYRRRGTHPDVQIRIHADPLQCMIPQSEAIA